MLRVILVGTGTGVGKTYVGCALARGLSADGTPVQALKPVETGVPRTVSGEPAAGSDAALLEAASSAVRAVRPHPRFAFGSPVSVHLAAAEAGVRVGAVDLRRWLDGAIAGAAPGVIQIVETAGGVFSPLSESETNFDLLRALGPGLVVLIAPDSLGVLHDLRATLLAMKSQGREPDLVALSGSRVPDASTGRNAGELSRLGLPEVITTLGRNGDGAEPLINSVKKHA